MKIVNEVPNMIHHGKKPINLEKLIEKLESKKWLEMSLEEFKKLTGSKTKSIASLINYLYHPRSNLGKHIGIKTRTIPGVGRRLYVRKKSKGEDRLVLTIPHCLNTCKKG